MPEKIDTRRPRCGFHMWDLVNIVFHVLEALVVVVGKPMVLELGRHTACLHALSMVMACCKKVGGDTLWSGGTQYQASMMQQHVQIDALLQITTTQCWQYWHHTILLHITTTQYWHMYRCRSIWYQFWSPMCFQCHNCDDIECIVSVTRCSRSDFGQSVSDSLTHWWSWWPWWLW